MHLENVQWIVFGYRFFKKNGEELAPIARLGLDEILEMTKKYDQKQRKPRRDCVLCIFKLKYWPFKMVRQIRGQKVSERRIPVDHKHGKKPFTGSTEKLKKVLNEDQNKPNTSPGRLMMITTHVEQTWTDQSGGTIWVLITMQR